MHRGRGVVRAKPDAVTVYPSENYYHFILNVAGWQVWGNIRLSSGQREEGVLSFGEFEFIEFPTTVARGINGSKFYGRAEGVFVEEVDRFGYTVAYTGKTVLFRLYELDQSIPTGLVLNEDERFIQRTSMSPATSSICCSTRPRTTSWGC